MQNRTMTTFATNVKKMLKEQGMLQKELAAACGMTENYLSDLLNRQPNTTIETVENIADVLGVDPGELISRPPRKKIAAA
ncbi:MAG TPA: helix-turn-helix transcriptional regulator [Planctomycetaceae bacterium]|nr:helix-turn-helix transcriptional regulator [Planctomycetaceae bacterium]HQZ66735.1 helix-turn-helix transcriptional regulator [Planctomycetaceae bacterium]